MTAKTASQQADRQIVRRSFWFVFLFCSLFDPMTHVRRSILHASSAVADGSPAITGFRFSFFGMQHIQRLLPVGPLKKK